MTPARQPQHIITDEDFDFIWKNISSPLIVRDRINVIKSRPHTPAPESGLDKWTYEDVMQEISDAFDRGVAVGEQAIAKAAREQVLKHLESMKGPTISKMTAQRNATLDEAIESLRAQQQGGVSE